MKGTFLKDLLSVIWSRVAFIIFGLGTSIVTARYLGPVNNGMIASLMIYPSLFITIGSLGIRQATTYFVGQNIYPIKDIYSSVLGMCIITSAFTLIVSYLLLRYAPREKYDTNLIILSIISIPFSLYITYTSGIFLGMQNIKAFNSVNWVPSFFNFVFTTLFVIGFKWGVPGSMLGTFLGPFILSFIILFKVRKYIPVDIKFNWAILKKMLSLGLVYAVTLLVISLNYKIDIVLLEYLSNKFETGIYSKGAALAEYLWIIPTLLSTLIFSRSAGAKEGDNFSAKACRLLRFAGIAIFLVSIVLWLLSDFIIYILYGNNFAGSSSVLKILIPGVLLLTIFKVLSMDLAGKGKPWISMIAMVPGVILNVILNFFWIPKYGANGSALASTFSYSFAALIFLWVYSKEVNIPILEIITFNKKDKQLIINTYSKFKKLLYR